MSKEILGKYVSVKGGYAFKSNKFVTKGVPIIRIGDLQNEKVNFSDVVYYPEEELNQYQNYSLQENDILIAMSGATTGKIGKITGLNRNCLLNQRVGKFEIKDKSKILQEYLYFIVRTPDFQKAVWKYASGCAQPNISNSQLESIEVSIPPIEIQKKIVAILEKAEQIKNWRKEADELSRDYLKSVFIEMFGDPIKNPKGWEKVKFKEIAKIERNSIKADEVSSNDKYIGLEDIESETGIILKTQKASEAFLKSSKFIFDTECVLYGKLRPYLNKVTLPNFKGVCSTDILPIRPKKDKTNKFFISFILKHPYYIKLATEKSHGANLPRVSPNTLESFEVYCPPFELQNKFASIVEKIEALKGNQSQSKTEADKLFDSLMQKAFNGELV